MSTTMNNQSLLQKADMVLADLQTNGGYLQPLHAQRFLRAAVDEAVIMREATVIPMRAPKQIIDRIRFGQRVLHPGYEARALPEADRSKPTMSQLELDAKLYKGEVRLTNEVLEDSLERNQLRQTIMELMAERIALDMDELLIRGDTTSSDAYLATSNGLLKSITSNVYDHTDNFTNRTLWKNMLKLMPSPFLRNKKKLRFLTSIDSEIDYRDALADRATANIGDRFVEYDAPAMYSGVPVSSIATFPENIGTGSHCTSPVLIDLKNLMVGIWRDIRVETDKLISEGVLLIVVSLRFGAALGEETAAVKANNVRVVA
jgi:HK97 family phage major capsid protein